MTEEQIERRAEREMDRLDAALMAGRLTQDEYDYEVRALDQWAEEEYRSLRA